MCTSGQDTGRANTEIPKLQSKIAVLQEAAEAAAKKAHLAQLQVQVEENERARRAAKAQRLLEGQHIKVQLEADKAIIEVKPLD